MEGGWFMRKMWWVYVWWLSTCILWIMGRDRGFQHVCNSWKMRNSPCLDRGVFLASGVVRVQNWIYRTFNKRSYCCCCWVFYTYKPPTAVNLVLLVGVEWYVYVFNYVYMCPTVEIWKFQPLAAGRDIIF
jgi:hypothetical protein